MRLCLVEDEAAIGLAPMRLEQPWSCPTAGRMRVAWFPGAHDRTGMGRLLECLKRERAHRRAGGSRVNRWSVAYPPEKAS